MCAPSSSDRTVQYDLFWSNGCRLGADLTRVHGGVLACDCLVAEGNVLRTVRAARAAPQPPAVIPSQKPPLGLGQWGQWHAYVTACAHNSSQNIMEHMGRAATSTSGCVQPIEDAEVAVITLEELVMTVVRARAPDELVA